MLNKNISQFFDIVDENSTVTDIHTEGNRKFITITKNLDHNLTCPLCGAKLHSKGKFSRHPNNQILQDGYIIELTVEGRRWKCSNSSCIYTYTDQFDFIDKRKRTTKIIVFQILMSLKDINLSCVQIARMYNVSDTFVHQTFMKYVNLPRKKLTEHICVDEVYLNISPTCKYALVIMDFVTGDILDIVESRRKIYTESYFLSIPLEERDNVKYICCDMYDPYVNYSVKFFHNAAVITDSFHVLQWLLRLINDYINKVKKRYQAKDKERLEKKNLQNNFDFKTIKESKEVFILKKAKWVLLLHPNKWTYYESHWVAKLNQYMDTYDWEREFLQLDNHFKAIRDLKDLYEEFNDGFKNDLEGAAKRLDELIQIYKNSPIYLFKQFSNLLIKYHDSIVNSFTYVKNMNEDESIMRRLSNGPMESFNNIPSRLRTQSHGVDNFAFTRNRILWSIRDDAPILGTPRDNKEIYSPGRKKGNYNKNK